MNEREIKAPWGRRDGIAIVLVLGLLSLLMVLTVAFSISMRIERAGAGNFAYSIGAKHMICAAVSRAMMDIDQCMHQPALSTYPDWTNSIMASAGSGSGAVKLGWGSALKHVPDALANVVAATPAGWIDIDDPNAGVVGRCAYLVVHCSGLLDANRVGGTNRMLGADAQEIQLYGADGGVPDIGSEAHATAFLQDRPRHGRYETLPEFRYLNTGLANPNAVSGFSIYSLSPEQQYMRADGALTNKVYVGGDATSLQAGQAAILQALADSGVSDNAARTLAYKNLLDYVDADSVPGNGASDLGSGATEMVPMINEVAIQCLVEVTGGSGNGICTISSVPVVEWFYPFDVQSASAFTVESSMTITPASGNTHAGLVPDSPGSFPGNVSAGRTYGLGTIAMDPASKTKTGLDTSTSMTIHFTVEAKGTVKCGGQLVDSVPYPYSGPGIKLDIEIPIPAVVPGGSWSVLTQEWAECIDPRFNWDPGNGGALVQWAYSKTDSGVGLRDMHSGDPAIPAEASFDPPAVNRFAEYLLKNPSGDFPVDFDGTNSDSAMHLYVANRPLQTVGELGNVCIRPWSTIRLYTHPVPPAHQTADPAYHKVVDCFTVSPSSAACARGRVNINTFNTNALAAVFYKVPETEFLPAGATLPWATATRIAGDIIRSRITSGAYNQLSAIGRTNDWASYVTGVSDVAREAPIRNSAGLLTVRDNLFTILLATGTTAHQMGEIAQHEKSMGDWFSYRRAVAVVWRDPFPVTDADGNMNHFWFVRYLNMLDD